MRFPATDSAAHLAQGVFGIALLDDGSQVLLNAGPGRTVGFSPAGGARSRSRAGISGSTFTVPAVWPGVTMQGQATLNGYKETLIVKRWTGRSAWTFEWSASGLTPTLQPDGSVKWADSTTGRVVARTPVPSAVSSSQQATDGKIALGSTTLTVSVNATWLKNALKSGPVKVDPSFITTVCGCLGGVGINRVTASELWLGIVNGKNISVWKSTNNGASFSNWAGGPNSYVYSPVVDLWSYANPAVQTEYVFFNWDELSPDYWGSVTGWDQDTGRWDNYGLHVPGSGTGHFGFIGSTGTQTWEVLDLYNGDLSLWNPVQGWVLKQMATTATSSPAQAFDTSDATWYAVLDMPGGGYELVQMNTSVANLLANPNPPSCTSFDPLAIAASQGHVAVAGDCGSTVVIATETNGGSWSYATTHLTDSSGKVSVAFSSTPATDYTVYAATASEEVQNGQPLGAQPYGNLSDGTPIVALAAPAVNYQPEGTSMDAALVTQDTCGIYGCQYDVVYIQRTLQPPTCSVSGPSSIVTGPFTVSWAGQGGSGPLTYDVDVYDGPTYVTSWQANTTATSATFSNLTWGHTYSFVCSATDSMGNQGPWSSPIPVTYSPPVGLRSMWTYQTWNLGAAGTVRVNVSDGDLLYTSTDSSVPTVAGPVTIQRSYNSLNTVQTSSLFGYGWTSPLLQTLKQMSGGPSGEMLQDGSGASFPYYLEPDGTYASPVGDHRLAPPVESVALSGSTAGGTLYATAMVYPDHLILNSYDYWYSISVVDLATGVMVATCQAPYWVSSASPNVNCSGISPSPAYFYIFGGTLDGLQPDTTYELTGVLGTAGITNGIRVTLSPTFTTPASTTGNSNYGLTDLLGNQLQFATSGPLAAYTDRNGNQLTYTDGNANGNLSAVSDPASGRSLSVALTSCGCNIASINDMAGVSTGYAYNGSGELTQVVRNSGSSPTQTLSYAYASDGSHHLTSITDPVGNTWQISYNSQGQVTEFALLQNGSPVDATSFSYSGNTTTVTDPNSHITVYTSAANGIVTSVKDARGYTTTYTVDNDGNVTAITDPYGKTTTMTYDSKGNETSVTDPLGHATTMTYTGQALLATKTDPNGNKTTYTYDGHGNLLIKSRTLNPGNQAVATTYTYTPQGLVATKKDPVGNTTGYSYNAEGEPTTVTDALGHDTLYTYNALGQVTQKTDVDGYVWIYSYNNLGWKTSAVDPNGAANGTTTYGYDADGRLTETIDPAEITTSQTYDAWGRVLTKTNGNGHTTTYGYDPAGNRLTVTDALGNTTTNGYDPDNELTSVIDPMGNVTTYGYDADRRRTSVQLPGQNATTYTYDAAGRMTSKVDTAGNTWTYTYDNDGNQLTVKDPLGNVTTNAYDSLSRLVSTTDALNHTASYAYDLDGRKTGVTNADNRTTTYTYDGLGRQTAVKNALGNTWSYSYDNLGNLLSETDPLNHKTSYTYDSLGDRLTMTDPLGDKWQYAYDNDGRLVQTTKPDGTVINYVYDGANHLTSESAPAVSITYTYNADEQPATRIDGTGTTTYSYNKDAEVTSIAEPSPAGTLNYSYSGAGQLASLTDWNGAVVSYGYNPAGQLSTVTDWSNNNYAFGYDQDGRLNSRSLPGGVSISTSYDQAGRVSGITESQGGATLASFAYTVDPAGLRTAVIESGSALPVTGTSTFGYDAAGELTSAALANGTNESWSYNTDGSRTNTTVNGAQTTYSYNAADELTTAGSTNYGYSANGDRTSTSNSAGTTTYSYDSIDQLIGISGPNLSVTYSYDGSGARVSKTVNGTTTVYSVDERTSTPVVFSEDDPGVGAQWYAYAPNGMVLGVQAATGTWSFPLNDAMGNMRVATNVIGAAVYGASYDPWGAATTTSGSTVDHYEFAHQFTDTESALLYMRARYYDPATGQFLTRDPLQGIGDHSLTWDPYLYAGNDPNNTLDPTGKFALADPTGHGYDQVSAGNAESWHEYYSTIALQSGPESKIFASAHSDAVQLETFCEANRCDAGPAGGWSTVADMPHLSADVTTTSTNNTPSVSIEQARRDLGVQVTPTVLPFSGPELIAAGVALAVGGAALCLAGGCEAAAALMVAGAGSGTVSALVQDLSDAVDSGGTTQLYRVVGEAEAQDIAASGAYQSPYGIEGKYFFTTQEQAVDLGTRYQDRGFGPQTLTTGQISNDTLAQYGEYISPATEGGAYYLPNEALPYVTNVTVLGPLP